LDPAPPPSSVQQAWISTYDGDTADDDGGQAVALDDLGNIYVTGYSYGSDNYPDYATIKYNAAGERLWVARYDGPASDEDWALDLAVGRSGSVYVTGWSRGNGTEPDCATIKYDSNGNQLWVARYDGPANGYDRAYAIAVDYSENVYVTGWSQGNGTDADYVTLKYDSNGNQLWVARYNGTVSSEDKSHALAVDGWANVYVTGSSRGNGTGSDITTIKYDSDGNQLWVARYGGPADGDDLAQSIAVDNWGDVYVTGWSEAADSGKDYVTLKYSSNGEQMWVARYDGPAHEDDSASGLALDSLGNIYVTGSSRGNDTEEDYATVKYDSNGNRLWAARYDGPSNAEDTAHAITLDGMDNPHVSGWSRGPRDDKYDAEGNLLWAMRYDYATIKYDAEGNQLWAIRYDGPPRGHDKAYALAVDSAGNTYVTGRTSSIVTHYDFTTIKYTP
jgi:uncharacterized delta-60 repeat protein